MTELMVRDFVLKLVKNDIIDPRKNIFIVVDK